MTTNDRDRLASYVRERRDALGLTQEDVATRGGPSTATLRLIETASPESPVAFRPKSLRQLETALGWEEGSAHAILRGGVPAERPNGRRPSGQGSRYSDPRLQHIWETPGMPESVRLGMIAYARGALGISEENGEPGQKAS